MTLSLLCSSLLSICVCLSPSPFFPHFTSSSLPLPGLLGLFWLIIFPSRLLHRQVCVGLLLEFLRNHTLSGLRFVVGFAHFIEEFGVEIQVGARNLPKPWRVEILYTPFDFLFFLFSFLQHHFEHSCFFISLFPFCLIPPWSARAADRRYVFMSLHPLWNPSAFLSRGPLIGSFTLSDSS